MTRCAPLLLLCVALSACAPKQFNDPLATMMDKDQALDWRLSAAKQLEKRAPRDPKRLAALDKLIWDVGHPFELREYAIDQLRGIDERDFRDKLGRRIVLIQSGQTLEYVFKLAVDNHWTDFTPAAVKSYARAWHGLADDERPERAVIEKLNPGKTVERAVFDVFAGPDDQVTHTQRIAAWALLNRITEPDVLMDYLVKAPDASALVVDLKTTVSELHVLPGNREEVKWMYYLREPSRRAYWDRLKAAVAKLSRTQRRGLALRHLAVLLHGDHTTMSKGRDELLGSLRAALAGQNHHVAAESFDQVATRPQLLANWEDKLTWADLVAIHTLLRAVRDRRVTAALFDQAESDRRNEAAEHGGVIDATDDGPVAAAHVPVLRLAHNRKFVPSEKMIQHSYTALAHYHFHAQEHRNGRYAGPGAGDVETANNLRFNFLVFTFINQNTLNVDYYQAGDVSIDLGDLKR